MRKILLGTAAAFITIPLMAVPVLAAPCAPGTVASYVALGSTGCSVDGLTFSNINVNTTVSGGGSVTLGNFTPFMSGNEFGLTLNYTALAPVAGATADVAWTYNVTGSAINDAFLALAGNTTGSGVAAVSEVLSNGVVLSLNAPGSTTATFPVTTALFVLKDQIDFVGPAGGSSTTSLLTNAFSQVPLPASLPLFAGGLAGLWALGRKRRNKKQKLESATA